MKTMTYILDELLENYQRYAQIPLRLMMNHHSVFSGFEGECKSEVKFEVQSMVLMLGTSQVHAEHALTGIVIALKPLLEMNGAEHAFANAVHGTASEMEWMHLEEKIQFNSWSVVLIQSAVDAHRLREMVEHMVSENALMTLSQEGLILFLEKKDDSIRDFLMSMKDTLETELYCRVRMAVSSVYEDVRELTDAACEVRRVRALMDHYDPSCSLAEASSTWVLEMMDTLSDKKAKQIVSVLVKGDLSRLDEELIMTLQCFLAHDLSISTTARELYVHRNTLIYRLDKIAQLTGLDIRHFEDAVKLRFALMLNKK